MPKISCCLCFRRTDTNKTRKRIGTDSVWPVFNIHAEKVGLDLTKFSKQDNICIKCHATLSDYNMTDRGPNKKVKIVELVVFEPIIKKDVLRGFSVPTITTVSGIGMFVDVLKLSVEDLIHVI